MLAVLVLMACRAWNELGEDPELEFVQQLLEMKADDGPSKRVSVALGASNATTDSAAHMSLPQSPAAQFDGIDYDALFAFVRMPCSYFHLKLLFLKTSGIDRQRLAFSI